MAQLNQHVDKEKATGSIYEKKYQYMKFQVASHARFMHGKQTQILA